MKFEIVSKYADAGLNLPVRKTKASAGYDFQVAEDTIIPSYFKLLRVLKEHEDNEYELSDSSRPLITLTSSGLKGLSEVAAITKATCCKPTLVPTGIKCEMPEDMYLELSVRSSCPLKHWLILANGVGVVDSDYYNNSDNEGHIFFQIINLSPFDIVLKKGDTIGQGILKKYYLIDEDIATGLREGGFGSTDNLVSVFAEGINVTKEPEHPTPLEKFKALYEEPDFIQLSLDLTGNSNREEECVMACNSNRFPYFVGKRRELPVLDEASTFTTEHHDVEYSRT